MRSLGASRPSPASGPALRARARLRGAEPSLRRFRRLILVALTVLFVSGASGTALAQVPVSRPHLYCEHCREFTIPYTPGQPVPVCPKCGRPHRSATRGSGSTGGSGGGGSPGNPLEQTAERIAQVSREIDALKVVRGRQKAELEPILRELAALKRERARIEREMDRARRAARRNATILENARQELNRLQKSYADREHDYHRSLEAIRQLRSGVPAHLLPPPSPGQVVIDLSALSRPRAEVRLTEADLAARIDPRVHVTRNAYEAARRDRAKLELAQRVLEERLAALDAAARDHAARTSTIESIRAEAGFGALTATLGVLGVGPDSLRFLPGRDRTAQLRLAQRWTIALHAASLAASAFETASSSTRQKACSRLAETGVELLKLKVALRAAGLTPEAAKRLDRATSTVDALVKTARFTLDPSAKNLWAYAKAGGDVLAAFSSKTGAVLAGLSLAGYAGQYQATGLLVIEWQRIQAPTWDARAHLLGRIQQNAAALKEVRRLVSSYESFHRDKEATP